MNTWHEENNMLSKQFEFTNFREALDFINKVGGVAEELQHHPDISIKNYNHVYISTTSHDAGNTVTNKDQSLAKAIDAIV